MEQVLNKGTENWDAFRRHLYPYLKFVPKAQRRKVLMENSLRNYPAALKCFLSYDLGEVKGL